MSTSRKRTLIISLLVLTVVLGFALRTVWNADAAERADGSYVLSGNDPYYHKHAVDHITTEWESIHFDPMLNYPIGSVNPNPPLYEWSIAAGATFLEPFAEDMDQAAWWSTLYSTAIWGALTAIPAFFIARMFAGPWAGLLAAFLVATSTEHMSRSNLGFSDHDAIYLFFIASGFYFLLRSIQRIGSNPPQARATTLASGFMDWFREQRYASGSAVLAGACFGAVALIWKGFPYMYGVLLAYAGIQFLVSHWRGKDNARPFYALVTTLGVTSLMGLPYYASFGLLNFWNPAFYLLLTLVAVGLFFVATQRYPSVLVIPGMLLIGVAFFLVLLLLAPEMSKALLGRFIYFNQNNLYQTIAEARPADFSSLAFTVGPIPFFVYAVGFPWLGYRLWQNQRPAEFLLFTWAAVDLFMGLSAIRFLFLIVPTMAVLAATTTIWIIRSMELPNLVEGYRKAGGGWRGVRRSTNVMHIMVILFVGLLLVLPNGLMAIDAAVPSNFERERAQEARDAGFEDLVAAIKAEGMSAEALTDITQRFNASRSAGEFRDQLEELQLQRGFSGGTIDRLVAATEDEFKTISLFQKRMGAFGTSFLSPGWRQALLHLSTLDQDQAPGDRPAFLAWWDYGHWSIAVGKHPTVADNFQNGYRLAGNFLVAQNESHAIQLMAARHARIMTEDAFADTLTEHGITQANATRLYDAFTSTDFPYIQFPDTPDERSSTRAAASWLATIEAETGAKIRYIAADNRMMPLDDPRSRQIESGSIFYAPVTLAEKDTTQFLETIVVDMNSGRELSEQELRAIRQGHNQNAQVGEQLVYKSGFFNSTYYRVYMGMPVREQSQLFGQSPATVQPIALENFQEYYQSGESMVESTVPINGFAITREKAPGFAMRHFRLIYANDAVRLLQYTPGATITGQVTLEQTGDPVPDVRVSVFDDAGEQVYNTDARFYDERGVNATDLDIPHDSIVVGPDGTFELTAPFSTNRGIELRVTQETGRRAPPTLASTTLDISEQDAEQGVTIQQDLEIAPSTITGVAFHDVNDNNELDDFERVLSDATITVANRTTTTGEDGSYSIENLMPGRQILTGQRDGFKLSHDSSEGRETLVVRLEGGEMTERDVGFDFLPVDVNATVVDRGGDAVEGINVLFEPLQENTTAREASEASGPDGAFEITLQPGNYTIGGNGTRAATNTTLEVVEVRVIDGTGAEVDGDILRIARDAADVRLEFIVEPATASP